MGWYGRFGLDIEPKRLLTEKNAYNAPGKNAGIIRRNSTRFL